MAKLTCGKERDTRVRTRKYTRFHSHSRGLLYSRAPLLLSLTLSAQPCLTLNQYANDSDHYFKSNTVFKFLPGTHHMDRPITIGNVHNMSLESLNSDKNDKYPHLVAQFSCDAGYMSVYPFTHIWDQISQHTKRCIGAVWQWLERIVVSCMNRRVPVHRRQVHVLI